MDLRILTEEDKAELNRKIDITSNAAYSALNGASGAYTIANEARTIAEGSSIGYVFDTEADMYAWLAVPDNVSQLKTGNSHFYIRDVNVPDYWWDGTKACQLETQKVDLSEYAKKESLNKKQDKTIDISFDDDSAILLADNTNYKASGYISTLTIQYPDADFMCSIEFTTAEAGDISISLPNSSYIGAIPEFANGETWELNIKNGVVVGGKVE